jgi:flavorubredoxin
MPSRKALKYAFEKILELPFDKIAPQHGSIITNKRELTYITKMLTSLVDVGIDGIIEDDYQFNFGNLDERFK